VEVRVSFYDKRRQWGALPLGELHPYGKCALCGLRGELDKELRRTVLLSTDAVACVCEDMMSCIRRRQGARAVA
jgi:hypothetical protein